eukprot:TRINITY_DN3651_c0_g1_i4.p4 TRINITY_DN3651_c0_g1~~TRINITY_DN3651_c0_g1_i4.p4  ORF type:complete len:113 (-),score=7.02 TRINITY_DN3651_c0_g1_i4:255-593(-)
MSLLVDQILCVEKLVEFEFDKQRQQLADGNYDTFLQIIQMKFVKDVYFSNIEIKELIRVERRKLLVKFQGLEYRQDIKQLIAGVIIAKQYCFRLQFINNIVLVYYFLQKIYK